MTTKYLSVILLLLAAITACKKNNTQTQPAVKAKYLTQATRVSGNNTVVTDYTYDDKKRLTTVVTGNSTVTFNYSLDVVSSMEIVTKNGDVVAAKVRNELTYSNNLLTAKKTFFFDGAGKLLSDLSNNYVYDDNGRLTEARQDGNFTFYEYSADGNISKIKFLGVEINQTFDGKKNKFFNLNPALKKIGTQLTFEEFFYSGNLVSSTRTGTPATTFTYQYDSEGYPVSATASNGSVYTFKYALL